MLNIPYSDLTNVKKHVLTSSIKYSNFRNIGYTVIGVDNGMFCNTMHLFDLYQYKPGDKARRAT